MQKILDYLHNYFYTFGEKGLFNIVDNQITVKGKYIQGQYIKLEGSIMNDSVYKVISYSENKITVEGAINEEFKGIIYSLAVPKELIELETKIKEYEANKTKSDIISESFGNYSYSRATNSNGDIADWKDVFKTDLKPYRAMVDSKRRVKYI